jgi:hypothetical protein
METMTMTTEKNENPPEVETPKDTQDAIRLCVRFYRDGLLYYKSWNNFLVSVGYVKLSNPKKAKTTRAMVNDVISGKHLHGLDPKIAEDFRAAIEYMKRKR